MYTFICIYINISSIRAVVPLPSVNILICNTMHSHVRHDSFLCAIGLVEMCDMSPLYV